MLRRCCGDYQVPNTPVGGKQAIAAMFRAEFADAEMVCIVGAVPSVNRFG